MVLFESNWEKEKLKRMPFSHAPNQISLGGEKSISKDAVSMGHSQIGKIWLRPKELKLQAWQYCIIVKPTWSGIIQTQSQILTPPFTKLSPWAKFSYL